MANLDDNRFKKKKRMGENCEIGPEITKWEYQQGELQGYLMREYVLEKWQRTCAYCRLAREAGDSLASPPLLLYGPLALLFL